MIFILSFPLLLLTIALVNGDLNLDKLVVRDLALGNTMLPKRQLRAATRVHEIKPRGIKGCLRSDHHLHYVDNVHTRDPFSSLTDVLHVQSNTRASTTHFAAKVSMKFKIPALLLEDIEHHTERIDCFDSRVYLYFNSAEALEHAHEEFRRANNFLLITSHLGCNKDGERNPHLVSESSLHLEERLITLSVSRIPWKSAFNAMTVDFGESNDDFEVRRHNQLQRRGQAAAPDTAGPAAATSISVTVTFPAAPTSTPTNFNVSANVNNQWLNTAILPPDSSLGQLSLTGPLLPSGLTIKCKNCTIQGSIELVAGSFTMGAFNGSSDGGSADFINHGYVELQSNNFGAHIELDTTVKATEQLKNFTVPLPPINFTPFEIPGIGAVGPQLVPNLMVGFKLTAELDFTTGFNLLVPDGSQIILDVGNVTNSSQHGFDKTNITTLPFQASANLDLITVGGFNPQLLLGISFFDGDAAVGAGIFLNLPTISTTFAAVRHVNSHCENTNHSTTTASKALDDLFDALTHVDTSVDFGIGLFAQAVINPDAKGSQWKLQEASTATLLQTGFALPTRCVSFDGRAKTFGPATTSSTGSPAPTKSAGGKSGSSRVANPIGDSEWGFGAPMVMMVLAAFPLFL